MSAARITGFAVLALASSMLLAQFQVNPRIDNSLYGASANTGSVHYSNSSSIALPSEVRAAYNSSGATPSEIKMNEAAIGPLAPGGAMSYIPPTMSPQRSSAPPKAQGSQAFTTGSVSRSTTRYNPNQSMMQPSGTAFNDAMPSQRIR